METNLAWPKVTIRIVEAILFGAAIGGNPDVYIYSSGAILSLSNDDNQ
jgi:hypothetical protein